MITDEDSIPETHICFILLMKSYRNGEHILVSVTAGGPESLHGHVVKVYGLLRMIHSVLRASFFFRIKIDRNYIGGGDITHPFWLQLVLTLFGHHSSTF